MIKIIEPGHIYELSNIDAAGSQLLTFIRTTAANDADNHSGTNSQAVIRALIDRIKYKDDQVPCIENRDILYHLRMALVTYEGRAYRRKVDKLNGSNSTHVSFRERDRDLPFDDLGFIGSEDRSGIENLPLGPDGHLLIEDLRHDRESHQATVLSELATDSRRA